MIVGCGKRILGTKGKVNNNHCRTYDDDIEELSKEQKELRLIISSSKCEYQIQAWKPQRNVLLKEIRKRVNANMEKEIEEAVKDMERLQNLECSKLQRCWTVEDSKTLLCMTKMESMKSGITEILKKKK